MLERRENCSLATHTLIIMLGELGFKPNAQSTGRLMAGAGSGPKAAVKMFVPRNLTINYEE